MTKKKCTARIVLYGKSTPAPTYSELWRNMRLNREEQMQFFFCFDDIERCVKSSRCKWIIPYSNTQERLVVPTIWPVKIGTNLTRSEIVALGECKISTIPKRVHLIESKFQQLCFTCGFIVSPSARKSIPLFGDQEVQIRTTIQY